MHVLLSDPFTNEFDDVSPGRLLRQVAQVCAGSLALPAKARPWIPATTHGLYTHALWQLPKPLKLTNLFEDGQSTPERTLRWLPLCTVAFSNLVAAFHSCLASHPLLICLGHRLLIRLCIFRRHGGLIPIVSEAIPMDLCGFLFGVAPAPFCVVSLFSLLAKRKSGGEICVSSLLPCFFLLFWFLHSLPRL